jgi:SAM-dependent methyltransferase
VVKKPKSLAFSLDESPSKFLKNYAQEIALNAPGPILDVACGAGRNAYFLNCLGSSVICLDNDPLCLETIATRGRRASANDKKVQEIRNNSHLIPIKLDLKSSPWIFPTETLGAIINIHFFWPPLLEWFASSLIPGGYLLIETIGGQGGNYLELPGEGFVRSRLEGMFDFRFYREKKVGPLDKNAVSVKLFSRKWPYHK